MAASDEPSGHTGMYEHSAAWFDLRYAQKDYAAEAVRLMTLVERVHPLAATLLDVACGTGRHLEHLRSRFRVEGLNRHPTLLPAARARVGGAPLHLADMADFDLGRSFDVVTCLFASLPYVRTLARMRQAVACMARHAAPGGILFIETGLTPATYRQDEVVHNFRRTPERAISWMYVMRRTGSLAVWDIHWLVGTAGNGVAHYVEREEFGLFTTDECIAAMRDVGLDVVHHARGLHGYGALIGRARPWTDDEKAGIGDVLGG